jgi:glycosyltransferase involved in cell wall biosynthesis
MSLIDIVIPCYEYGRFLKGCVSSIVDQGIEDLRILIIDNASSDNSVEIARELAAMDSRVQVVARRVNLGVHASFNEGIDWAQSDYFLILCADDLLTPGALRHALHCLALHPDVHLTHGGADITMLSECARVPSSPERGDEWEIVSGMDFIKRACSTGRSQVAGPTAIVRTSVQKKVGYYREELDNTTDFEMWMRFACHGSVAKTTRVQAIARTHPGNISAQVANIEIWNRRFLVAFSSFFQHEGAALPERDEMLRRARRSLGERAYCSAFSHFCRGEMRVGFDLLKFVWETAPTMMVVPPVEYLRHRGDTGSKLRAALNDLSGGLMPGRRRAPGPASRG